MLQHPFLSETFENRIQMKIYTRTGDQGTTGLFGGNRVKKTNLRIVAYGTVDETNSHIGLARAFLQNEPSADELDPILARIQNELFILGADLATPLDSKTSVPRLESDCTRLLEEDIDLLDTQLPPLKQFILPGGTATAAQLHIARTVCRRAERTVVETAENEPVNEKILPYLNRLSDFLFVAARWQNYMTGQNEVKWTSPE